MGREGDGDSEVNGKSVLIPGSVWHYTRCLQCGSSHMWGTPECLSCGGEMLEGGAPAPETTSEDWLMIFERAA